MNHDPTEVVLPPDHVPTVRIATPDPRHARRHILVPSGWKRDHFTACQVTLPMDCCETGSAPVDDIDCPYCHKSPEFARAVEQARNPKTNTGSRHAADEPAPPAAPETPQPQAPRPTRPYPARKKAEKPRTSPQGSLF
jgi:hypothetical protein